MSPLERWAARNPRLRWPLVWLCIVFLWGLAGALDAEATALLPLR